MSRTALSASKKSSAPGAELLDSSDDDSTLPIDSAALMGPTRLSLPSDLSLAAWRAIGEKIVAVSKSSGWWLGDWLIYGQERYPDRYRRAMRETLLDYQTLRNYAWVARSFDAGRRRSTLSLQHHMEVAALPPEEQDHWLDFAVKMQWSRNELRKQVKASSLESGDADPVSDIGLNMNITKERMEHWKAAAKFAGSGIHAWMVSTLDRAARGSSTG